MNKSKYDLYLKDLLKTIKKKGIKIETMPKGVSFCLMLKHNIKKI